MNLSHKQTKTFLYILTRLSYRKLYTQKTQIYITSSFKYFLHGFLTQKISYINKQINKMFSEASSHPKEPSPQYNSHSFLSLKIPYKISACTGFFNLLASQTTLAATAFMLSLFTFTFFCPPINPL